ncbi:restriction endonuclease [Candidatus Bipolaricaulota bacterium]
MPKASEYPHTSSKRSETYTKSGLVRHVVEVRHLKMGKYRVIKDANERIAKEKANAQLREWDQQWQKAEHLRKRSEHLRKSKETAAGRTALAQERLSGVQGILQLSLTRSSKLTPRSKRFRFSEKESEKPKQPKPLKEPPKPSPKRQPPRPEPDLGTKPSESDAAYEVKPGFLAWLAGGSHSKREEEARDLYRRHLTAWEAAEKSAIAQWESRCREVDEENRAAISKWESRTAEVRKKNAEKEEAFQARKEKWEERNARWAEKKASHESDVQGFFEKYRAGEPDAVTTYLAAVLDGSPYPDWFPREHDLSYNPETRVGVVDFRLPTPTDLPSTKEVTYVQARDEFTEKTTSGRDQDQLYDSAIYQVALRTVHECFEATSSRILASLVFNGYVRTQDSATGKSIQPYILSVQAQRSEFSSVDLTSVDPKECIRKLRGVGSSKLHALAPVAPLLTLDKTDSRFIQDRDVVGTIDQGTNLAAMPWDDFEHLIRGLFEKMFAERGAEVKVTQQSRDRGVDAVVFDPDPITGGKIIIQAKRYTNPVQAADVRELFGVVQHEGAKLGILVTTTDYGPDAIKWAANKPLRLLNGGNLLHELEKQGHKAYIDILEAKEILKAEES